MDNASLINEVLDKSIIPHDVIYALYTILRATRKDVLVSTFKQAFLQTLFKTEVA